MTDRFESVPGGTVGLEEEVLLLDPRTFAPLPIADEILARLPEDGRFKREMPAAQIELVTPPGPDVATAVRALRAARDELTAATAGVALPAAAAVHPEAPGEVALNPGDRYAATLDRHAVIARRQLVGALHVHVAIGGAERTFAVYNAIRELLPEIAALAAAAPFHAGIDTGLASVRPLIGGQLPRQGVPPALASAEAFEDELRWGAMAGVVDDPGRWWWELRPHHLHGTLELRVADVQPTLAQTAAVAEFAVALLRWLAARHDAGEPAPAPAADWRIAENRWLALRHGVEGTLADLRSGIPRPTRERLLELMDAAEPFSDGGLDAARALAEHNSAMDLRAAGQGGACRWLTTAFAG
jgi:carboxylate-amine ligase